MLGVMREATFGELKVRLVGGEDRHGGGDGPLVVLMHGFGAPGTDLVALPRVMDVPRAVRFAFPEAPLALPAAYGAGRAWWMLDAAALERAIASGEPRDLRGEDPEGLAAARDAMGEALEAMVAELAPRGLALGGFSQGAMLATELTLQGAGALEDAGALDGLALLSGAFLAEARWRPRMAGRAGLEVFQSHGEQDALLSFAAAEALRDALREAGLSVEWRPFRGGHEIPMGGLDDLAAFLRRVLPAEEDEGDE